MEGYCEPVGNNLMAQDNSECRQAITEFYLEVDFLQTFNAAVNDGFRLALFDGCPTARA